VEFDRRTQPHRSHCPWASFQFWSRCNIVSSFRGAINRALGPLRVRFPLGVGCSIRTIVSMVIDVLRPGTVSFCHEVVKSPLFLCPRHPTVVQLPHLGIILVFSGQAHRLEVAVFPTPATSSLSCRAIATGVVTVFSASPTGPASVSRSGPASVP
jgi:hypothetical protein